MLRACVIFFLSRSPICILEVDCMILLFVYRVMLWVRDGVATIPTTLIIAFVTLNWWINVIVATSIFVLRRPILSAIRRKRASSSFGGAVILVSGVEKIVTSQEDLLVLSMSFPPTSSNLPPCIPMRGTHRFGIKGKLAPRYIDPFKF